MLRDNIRTINLSTNDEGIVQCYDVERDKLLSIDRETFTFGIDHMNVVGKRWLKLIGSVKSNISGYKMQRNATITSMTVQSKNTVIEARINIRVNNLSSNVYTAALSSQNELINNDLNIDINKGDYLQAFMSVLVGNIDYPVVTVEVAWR
jgi:hypothetical protein